VEGVEAKEVVGEILVEIPKVSGKFSAVKANGVWIKYQYFTKGLEHG